jgi:hypothetical protein
MDITKASWSSDHGKIRVSMPISKVDVEKRTVSGFATLDNLDKQGDVVPSEASKKAFERFRGNIREMHQPLAVGKVVSFKEDKFFDDVTQKFYTGIFVSAYVSKGAQDTWEKVLDGTLTGFSIGGVVNDDEDVYDADMNKAYRVIKDYDLSELSLVDNPANQFANVLSIEKNTDDHGYLSKTMVENVYWCSEDDIISMSKDESSSCPQCDSLMSNIGFVESDDTDKASVVKSMVHEVKSNGFAKGDFVRFGDTYGRIENIVFKGGAKFESGEVVNATPSDPVVIVKSYVSNGSSFSATSNHDITHLSTLSKVNTVTVEEVRKMSEEVIVVEDNEDLEKGVADRLRAQQAEAAEAPAEAPAPKAKAKAKEVEEPVAEVEEVVVEEEAEEVVEAEFVEAEVAEEAPEGDVDMEKATAVVEESEASETEEAEEEVVEEAEAVVAEAENVIDMAAYVANQAELTETITSSLNDLAETVKAVQAQIDTLHKGLVAVDGKVNSVTDNFGKRVDAVEKDTAFRKSADLGEILQELPKVVEKSTSAWGGRFLTNADLLR